MPQQQPDFGAVLDALIQNSVRFAQLRGLAMVARGAADVTVDANVCYARDPQNIDRLAAAWSQFHPYLRGAPKELPFRWDARTIRAGANFRLVTDWCDVDSLSDVPGLESFEGLWERAEEMELFGGIVRVAGIDDLIAMKSAASRDKDRQHLLSLAALKRLTDA